MTDRDPLDKMHFRIVGERDSDGRLGWAVYTAAKPELGVELAFVIDRIKPPKKKGRVND